MDNEPRPSYADRTSRIKTLIAIAWTVLIAIVVTNLLSGTSTQPTEPITIHVPPRPTIDRTAIKAEILTALSEAKSNALSHGSIELDQWMSELNTSAENSFAPWYFDYINQQCLALQGVYAEGRRFLMSGPTASEAISAKIEEAFASRVLCPEAAAMRYQRIVQDSTRVFVETLNNRVSAIPTKLNISPVDWQNYLKSSGPMIRRIGNRQLPLIIKAAAVPTVAGGVIAGKAVSSMVKSLVSKITGRVVATSAEALPAGMVAETAGVMSRFAGPVIASAVIGWDLLDHAITVDNEKPVLLENIRRLLSEIRESLFTDNSTGLIGVLNAFEADILAGLHTDHVSR